MFKAMFDEACDFLGATGVKAMRVGLIAGAFLAPAAAWSAGSPESLAMGLLVNDDNNAAMGSQIRKHEHLSPEQLAEDDLMIVVPAATSYVPGMDVSSYQGNVDWTTAYNNGARFAYVKATEGNYYINSYFAQQYNGSYNAGMIRGAYHFANPSSSSGSNQASYFLSHGGGWSKDGKTLPGALDMEYNPYGSTCYGLSQSSMATWIKDFVNYYKSKTTQYPVIYTSASWWSTCLGTSLNLSSTDPLWVARYSSSVGTLPYPWTVWTIWQYADSGTFPGDQDKFNGSYSRLQALANGS